MHLREYAFQFYAVADTVATQAVLAQQQGECVWWGLHSQRLEILHADQHPEQAVYRPGSQVRGTKVVGEEGCEDNRQPVVAGKAEE